MTSRMHGRQREGNLGTCMFFRRRYVVCLADVTKILRERHQQSLFQELEEARLGKVFMKAWKDGYESEVNEDVRLAASKTDMKIPGDEVDIGEEWEHVFEVEGRALRFRPPL